MIFKLFLLSTLVGLASSACFDNGDKEIGGSCYKFVAQKLSFEDARNWCHYKNPVTASYLAYVPNQFTSNFLASYARSAFGTNDGSFWIGLSRKSGGSWSWDAGFPLGYTNFGDQVGQNYVAESIVNAKWNTFGASDTNFFVCGYDPAAPPTFAPQTAGPSGPTPTMRATTQPVPTTTEKADSCTPFDKTTFLYAYSNDFDPALVESALNYFSRMLPKHYSYFASIRFDVENQEDIQFSTDFDQVASYVDHHLPDPSLSFRNSSTGSDVLTMINRFLDNTQFPVCGSKVFILVKRYPNEIDISSIVAKLRQHHSYIFIVASNTPTAGHHPEVLYDLASRTNGHCEFDDDDIIVDAIYVSPYLFYAVNVQVSGNGSMQLPSLLMARNGYWFTITVQDNGPMEVVQSVVLRWSGNSTEAPGYHIGRCPDCSTLNFYGNQVSDWDIIDNVSYNMTLNYQYLDTKSRTLQIRIYGDDSVDYWPPYDN